MEIGGLGRRGGGGGGVEISAHSTKKVYKFIYCHSYRFKFWLSCHLTIITVLLTNTTLLPVLRCSWSLVSLFTHMFQ